MSPSRLRPDGERAPLRAAPTTSAWWRAQVLTRSWLGRHRRRWLAPALVCVPPVGVAMLWAGATRPGAHRRWVTAGALAWMLLVIAVLLGVSLPGNRPDAAAAPLALAARTGAATTGSTPTPGATPTTSTAPAAAAAAPASSAAGVDTDSDGTVPASGGGAGSGGGGAAAPVTPGPTGAPTSSAPVRRSDPPASSPPRTRPPATPTPTRQPTRSGPPSSPSLPQEMPFSACTREGASAVSPLGLSLRCTATPLGLFWLWG